MVTSLALRIDELTPREEQRGCESEIFMEQESLISQEALIDSDAW